MSKGWSWTLTAALIIGVLGAFVLGGCSGGDGIRVDPDDGSVSGRVVDFESGVGLGGATITIGGRSAESDANGNFEVTGINPGTYNIIVTPPVGFVLPPGSSLPAVQVLAGQTTELSAPIVLFDEIDNPPSPP